MADNIRTVINNVLEEPKSIHVTNEIGFIIGDGKWKWFYYWWCL
jgi:hypothetical protein